VSILHNIRIEANADFALAVRWTEDGVVQPLSSAELTIAGVLEATVANGRITLDPVDGWATVFIPAAMLGALPAFAPADYDMLLTRTSDGRVKRALEGTATYSAGVS
jgi:hypothetical protein